MRDFGADHRWLSINTATVRQSGDRSAFEELEVVTLSRPDAIVSALQSRLEQCTLEFADSGSSDHNPALL